MSIADTSYKPSMFTVVQGILAIEFKRGGVSSQLEKYLKDNGLVKRRITEKGKEYVTNYIWTTRERKP